MNVPSVRKFMGTCRMVAIAGRQWGEAVRVRMRLHYDMPVTGPLVTKAPEKRCSRDGHQRSDVGITGQIQDESVKVETLPSYISVATQSHHHDSPHYELMRFDKLSLEKKYTTHAERDLSRKG